MALAMIYLGVRVGHCLLACMHLKTLSDVSVGTARH